MGWMRGLWLALWPNMIAPSVWTILGIATSHAVTGRRARRHHEEMKLHVSRAGKRGS